MASITIAPEVGHVGDKVTLRGSGLSKSKRYEVEFGGERVTSFTATSKGTVPAGFSFLVPVIPAVGRKGEMGTKLGVNVIPKGKADAEAALTFELQAIIRIDATSAYLGQAVKAIANGLLPSETYQLVMLSRAYHAFPAGILETDTKGSGTTVFVVPGYLGPGHYRVDLKHRAEGYPATQNPPPLSVVGYSPDALIAGQPKPSPRPGMILIPFTNTTPTALMPVVYAIIQTTKRRPLQITSSTVSLQPESTSDTVISFAHLPRGKYLITCFATSATGHIVSKMFNFPLEL